MSGLVTLAFSMEDLPPSLKIGIPTLGVLLIIMSMMMGIKKKRKASQERGTAREQVEDLKQRHAVRGDLEQLMVEIEQLAKRFGAQLDAKTLQMERLIDEADRKIHELKQVQQARQNTADLRETLASNLAEASGQGTPGASGAPTATNTEPAPQNPDEVLKKSVYALVEQGVAPAEIARQLDEHVGKIELILALRKS